MKPSNSTRFALKAASDQQSVERSFRTIPSWTEIKVSQLSNPDRLLRGSAVFPLATHHHDKRGMPTPSATATSRPRIDLTSTEPGKCPANNFSSAHEPTGSDPVFREFMAPLLKVSDAALVLAVSVKTIRRMIDRHDLPSVRIGRAIRIRSDDLQFFMDRRAL